MVCLGVTMALMSTSTAGKLLGAWLPIFMFFAQGFEHAVVNMFLIPAGMMLGAKITWGDWWLWNQIPVTLGNLAGGLLFIAVPWFITFRTSRTEQPRTGGSGPCDGGELLGVQGANRHPPAAPGCRRRRWRAPAGS